MFVNVYKQAFHVSHGHLSQKVKGVLMWDLHHMTTKILADSQICISVPLAKHFGI